MAKRNMRDFVLELARNNPDWCTYQIVDEARKIKPHYSVTSVRVYLREAGIVPPKPSKEFRRTDEYYATAPKQEYEAAKPKAEPRSKPSTHRASIQSYHGRSRLSAGYTEL